MKVLLKASCQRCGTSYVRAVDVDDDDGWKPLPSMTGVACTNTTPVPPTWDRCSWLYSELRVDDMRVVE